MDTQAKFGKIVVYGKEIDLDNTSKEDLQKMRDVLVKRLDVLASQYMDLYNSIY